MAHIISNFGEMERIQASTEASRRQITQQIGIKLGRCICDLPEALHASFRRPPQKRSGGVLVHA